ncbi:protein COFACTOR ASSEMBLY OF COMPLEX C SUBUNIT B CCB3, chloroplastic [Beta vulgaris subsp. vulgaris]|uniref:protein COFACTOR ASSEMBLY OF COMPLEX C SUBUNIT B CCB3, chloroplastic n=1 Tax=Beta vulgaris subsp. vulgaris TaxID=3555 RepID=UPI002037058A|nr:protein COFACTOR ASSEMBLY OF COMPLEX C SUBUNIT B CCB3, chloroplastic [Beta vulgaris subsp. vulgaris]XP_010688738.2 protein COFACTOR ASSEMBLY OF COMPLEX C SUBUNIT B CCB3, chloroplastic [Beta vulgaris subsp. vulgaris]
MATLCKPYPLSIKRCWSPVRRNIARGPRMIQCSPRCVLGVTVHTGTESLHHGLTNFQPSSSIIETSSHIFKELNESLVLMDLDSATAKVAIAFIGPFLSGFSFLFIVRIVMSWYPKLPVGKFPYVVAYAPTEPILVPTRKVIPPLGGVDVTPVVWFGLLSFLNEILVGPQGLLVLLSQQT